MTLADKVQIMFFAVAVIVTVTKFVKSKHWQSLTPKSVVSNVVPLLATVIPICGALLLSQLQDAAAAKAAPYFGGAAVLGYLLSQFGVVPELRSFLLLIASVCLARFVPGDSLAVACEGAIAGLLTWKLAENLLHRPESRIDDILPAFTWLVGLYWTSAAGMSAGTAALQQALLLSTLTVAIFIRWVQAPLLLSADDPVFLKRLLLPISGGLMMLIIINKLLVDAGHESIALLAGGGFLLTYLLQVLERDVDGPALARGVKNILLVGIAALAATRLFGTGGLLILAATSTIGPRPGAALLAGMFFATRALLQSYVTMYDPNVTGINMMHSYATAAQYAGFLIPVVAALFVRDLKDRRMVLCVLLAACFTIPTAANFFLHAEPTGSLLVSVCVTGILVCMLSVALFQGRASDQENVILIPAQMVAVALLTSELLEKGDTATSHDRLVALAALSVVVLLIALLNQFLFTRREPKPAITADASS